MQIIKRDYYYARRSAFAFFFCLMTLTASAIFIYSPVVWADDASMGRTPDGVYPMDNADIVLVDEEITVEYLGVKDGVPQSRAECRFLFKNMTNKDRHILMGFPAELPGSVEGGYAYPGGEALRAHDFKAWVNSKPVKIREEKGVSPPVPIYNPLGGKTRDVNPRFSSWYTFDVHIGAGQTVEINNTYQMKNWSDSSDNVRIGYILTTGRVWDGPIGHARVSFVLNGIKPYEIVNLHPATFRFEDGNLVWEKSNFEPVTDLEVIFNLSYFNAGFISQMGEDYQSEVMAVKAGFAGIASLDPERDRAEIITRYQKTVAGGNDKNRLLEIVDYGPVMASLLLSKLEPEAIKHSAPQITALEVENLSPESHKITGRIHDNDADVVAWRIVLSHMQDHSRVIDYDYTEKTGFYRSGIDVYAAFATGFDALPTFINLSTIDSDGNTAKAFFKYDGKSVVRLAGNGSAGEKSGGESAVEVAHGGGSQGKRGTSSWLPMLFFVVMISIEAMILAVRGRKKG